MNLNTFARHEVFAADGMASLVAARLRDPDEIQRARVFPCQLLTAYRNSDPAVPEEARNALQDAMELAIANIPSIEGQIVVCPDVSGSMKSPVTGHRAGSTTAVQCIDVAALVAASVLRKNPSATVLPFKQAVSAQLLRRLCLTAVRTTVELAIVAPGTISRRPIGLKVALALAQIGEFLLAALGRQVGALSNEAMNPIVAAAIISIMLNPMLYRGAGLLEKFIERHPRLWRALNRKAAREHDRVLEYAPEGAHRAVVVDTGRSDKWYPGSCGNAESSRP